MEDARRHLLEVTGNARSRIKRPNNHILAEHIETIIHFWQLHAGFEECADHGIVFGYLNGVSVCATLLQVFALAPEKFQKLINFEHPRRFPVPAIRADGSWLSEEIMNVIVLLSDTSGIPDTHFGYSLALMSRESMDQLATYEYKADSYLEYLVGRMENGAPESVWNPESFYTFPPSTRGISFFWNHSEAHWVVIKIDTVAHQGQWGYTVLNSMNYGDGKELLNLAQKHMPFLERLICRASPGIPVPTKTGRYEIAVDTPQQQNGTDCGVFAIYNCIASLTGEEIDHNAWAHELRYSYLQLVLNHLVSLPLPPSPVVLQSSTMSPLRQIQLPSIEPGVESEVPPGKEETGKDAEVVGEVNGKHGQGEGETGGEITGHKRQKMNARDTKRMR
ncbi:uncharacterized protein L3040_003881 [Drepanopeziza brunnea f. sp. 'multigermtubi']|uniref:uncharacterized protein n=1 Tax=Drepanopeziza brunnea f. sp. 'multigermtubi' TaxID=698441 RepID=UPI00239BE021|nr:hypothetical protein L3040_003881 [Drepanopeziza brunnea f. sp. 'multigermtubi']